MCKLPADADQSKGSTVEGLETGGAVEDASPGGRKSSEALDGRSAALPVLAGPRGTADPPGLVSENPNPGAPSGGAGSPARLPSGSWAGVQAGEGSGRVRVLACRVDASVVAARVRLSADLLLELQRCATVAASLGSKSAAPFEWTVTGLRHPTRWMFLARRLADGRFLLRNDDVSITIDPVQGDPGKAVEDPRRPVVAIHGPDLELSCGHRVRAPREDSDPGWIERACPHCSQIGWSVVVEARALLLARMKYSELLEMFRELLASFGLLVAWRQRRIDLAADVTGWQLAISDGEAFVKPPRAKLGHWEPLAKDLDPDAAGHSDADHERAHVTTYRSEDRAVTGHTVCPGGAIMARIYDKVCELNQPGRFAKRQVEVAIWQAAGWTGRLVETASGGFRVEGPPVVRVEFQVRGEALEEMGLRDPLKLASSLDSLWAYCVARDAGRGKGWLRLVLPDDATRLRRCATDPRWRVLQETIWVERAEPAVRLRRRGLASLAQALGSTLAALADEGMLAAPRTGNAREVEHIDQLHEQAGIGGVQYAAAIWVDGVVEGLRALLLREADRDPRMFAARLLLKMRASEARRGSVLKR